MEEKQQEQERQPVNGSPEPKKTTALARPMAFGQRGVIITNVTELMALAKQFAESHYFARVDNASQAIVKIQYGAELGIPPMASMLGIHIIEGRPSLSAGLVATVINRSEHRRVNIKKIIDANGKIIGQEWDRKHCTLVFEGRERDPSGAWRDWEWLGESTFEEADAQAAGLLPGKEGSNWRKWPKAMYYARALTQGARVWCPDVFYGAVYTPEELGDDFIDMNPMTGERSEPPDPPQSDKRKKAKSSSEQLAKWEEDKKREKDVAQDAVIVETPTTVSTATSTPTEAAIVDPEPSREAVAPAAVSRAHPTSASEGEAKASKASTPTDDGGGSEPASQQGDASAATSAQPIEATPKQEQESKPVEQQSQPQSSGGGEKGSRLVEALNNIKSEADKVKNSEQAAKFLQQITTICAKYSRSLDEKQNKMVRLYARGLFNTKRGAEATAAMKEEEAALFNEAKSIVEAQ